MLLGNKYFPRHMDQSDSGKRTPPIRLLIEIIVLIVSVIVLVSLVWYMRTDQRTLGGLNSNVPSDQAEGESAMPQPTFPPIPPEEYRVYSYAGRVTAHDTAQKILTIQTLYGEKKVIYSDGTAFLVSLQPSLEERQTLQPDELAAMLAAQEASASDVAVDTTIVAQSDENIRGKEEFAAVKITIIKQTL